MNARVRLLGDRIVLRGVGVLGLETARNPCPGGGHTGRGVRGRPLFFSLFNVLWALAMSLRASVIILL